MPAGRLPMEFDQEYADTLCGIIAQSEKSLATIVKVLKEQSEDNPAVSTVMKWLRTNEDFAKQYAHAKDEQAEFLAEQIIEIADDSSEDEIFTDEGKRILNTEFVQRSKLRVEARKWIASKLKPKKYGDKVETTLKGDAENPLIVSHTIEERLNRAKEKALASRKD